MDKRDLYNILVIILLSLLPRIIVAPYTSGSDIPQFAGFTDTFLRHGLCFYKYADIKHADSEDWPYPWPYVYGPGLILLLSPLRLIAPTKIIHYWSKNNYYVYVPMDWIIASKSLFILFDILSAIMIYLFIRRLGYRYLAATLLTLLYALNPMTIYISSIYGMFDQIPLFFFILGLYFYTFRTSTYYKYLGLFLTGFSISIKHTFLYPLIIVLIDALTRLRKWGKLVGLSMIILGSIILFLPFEIDCPSSIYSFINIILSSSKPGYTPPICYSFNGVSSLATYLHDATGKDLLYMINYWWIPSIILLLIVIIGYTHNNNPVIYSGLAYIVFTTTYWRVNHQYLVPAIAFSILIIAYLRKCVRCQVYALIYIFLAGLWPIMFPTSWWAHAHIREPNMFIWKLLDSFSLMVFNDIDYLIYSLILTITGYIYVVETSLHGIKPGKIIGLFRRIHWGISFKKRIMHYG
jgi:hypothetical protein